jgi:hypothetical protein
MHVHGETIDPPRSIDTDARTGTIQLGAKYSGSRVPPCLTTHLFRFHVLSTCSTGKVVACPAAYLPAAAGDDLKSSRARGRPLPAPPICPCLLLLAPPPYIVVYCIQNACCLVMNTHLCLLAPSYGVIYIYIYAECKGITSLLLCLRWVLYLVGVCI